MAAERQALEAGAHEIAGEWVERQQKRIQELEAQFAEMQKRFEENVARVVEAVKESELRGPDRENFAAETLDEARSEAREELNAAVVQTISESQRISGLRQPLRDR